MIPLESIFSADIERLKNLAEYKETKATIKDSYINMSKLKSMLSKYEAQFKDPIVNKKAIEFFAKKLFHKDQDKEYNIASIKFILTTENQLVSINELFIPVEGMPTLPACIEIDLLHKELASDKKIVNWLNMQGAQYASIPAIIEAKIYKLIKQPKLITKENTIEVTRFIFACHEAEALNQTHYQKLQFLPLRISQGRFEQAVNCYLSDIYQPQYPIQQLVPEISFVCEEYLTGDGLGEIQKWQDFFRHIGVKGSVEHFYYPSIKRSELDKLQIPQTKSYFDNLKNLGKSPTQGKLDEHEITNFISINHIDNLRNVHFATLFFLNVNAYWQQIKQYLCNSQYKLKSRSNSLDINETYFIYYMHNCAYFSDLKGEIFRTKELHTPNYHQLQSFGLRVLEISLDFNINEEIYEIFGFKTQLQLEDIVTVLVNIEVPRLSINKLIEIYTLMFKELFKIVQKSKQANVEHAIRQLLSNHSNKPLKLLATDTTLKPSDQLIFYPNVDNKELDNSYLKFLPTCSIEVMQNACALLGVRMEDAKNLEPVFVDARKIESNESDSLYKCLIQILPLVVLIEAQEHCKEVRPYFAEIKAKFCALNIYEAKAIIKKDKLGRVVEKPYADLYRNSLYYVGRWNKDFTLKEIHEKLIELFAFSTQIVRKNIDVFLRCRREDQINPMLQKYRCDIKLYKDLVNSLKIKNNVESQFPKIDDSSQTSLLLDSDPQSADSSEMNFTNIVNETKLINSTEINKKFAPQMPVIDDISRIIPLLDPNLTNTDSGGINAIEMVEEIKVAKLPIQAQSISESTKSNNVELTVVQSLKVLNTTSTSNNSTNNNVAHKKSPLKKSLEIKATEPVAAGSRDSDIKKKEKMNEFKPEIKKEELSTFDFTKVHFSKSVELDEFSSFVKKNNTNDPTIKFNSGDFKAPKESEKLSQETAVAIGLWGEEFVYNKLKFHYKEKYQSTGFSDTEKGFKIQTTDIELEVIWENKNGETGKPYDIQISKKKANEEKVDRKIDVKATRNKDVSLLNISEAEWKVATEYKNRYRIFRVYNAGSREASIKKIKDPVALLKNNKITVAKMQFKL